MKLTQDDMQKVSEMLTKQHGIRVICAGGACYTDGKTIHLPSIPDIDGDPELVTLVRYFLDHEVSHIVGNSDMSLMGEIKGQENGEAKAGILDVLEDVRVEQITASTWDGCNYNLREGTYSLMERMDASDDPANQHPFRQLLVGLYCGGKDIEPPKFVSDQVRDIIKQFPELIDIAKTAGSTNDLIDLTDRIYELYSQIEPPKDPSQGSGGEQKGEGDGNEGGQNGGGGGLQGGAGRSGGESRGSDNEASREQDAGDGADAVNDNSGDTGTADYARPGADGGSDDSKDEGHVTADEGSDSDGREESGVSGKLGGGHVNLPAPDWDLTNIKEATFDASKALSEEVKKELLKAMNSVPADHPLKAIVPEIDKIVDITPTGASGPVKYAYLEEAKAYGGPMRQKLAMILQSEAKRRWRGGQLKGTPDPKTIAALAAGTSDRVLRRREMKRAPDTACYLLIDGSGSMDGIMAEAVKVAMAFAHTLEISGHASSVSVFQNGGNLFRESHKEDFISKYGKNFSKDLMGSFDAEPDENGQATMDSQLYSSFHRTFRWDGIVLYVAKKWGEKLIYCVDKMLAASKMFDGGTPMCPALEIASKDLLKRKEKRKVMMIFTDGCPHEYDRTKRMIVDVEKAGIEVVLIGIQSDVVERLHTKYAVVNRMEDLGSTVMAELKKALHVGL